MTGERVKLNEVLTLLPSIGDRPVMHLKSCLVRGRGGPLSGRGHMAGGRSHRCRIVDIKKV